MTKLGDRVRAFRIAKGWNTAELAKAVGTSRQNIENLEAGKTLRPGYIGRLARAMDTSADDLLGLSLPAVTPFLGVAEPPPPYAVDDLMRVVERFAAAVSSASPVQARLIARAIEDLPLHPEMLDDATRSVFSILDNAPKKL